MLKDGSGLIGFLLGITKPMLENYDMFWKNKSVIIIGGAGFIGSHICDRLIKLGAKLTIIDDFSTGSRTNCNRLATIYEADASKDISKIFEISKPEIVMTFASIVDVPTSIQDPITTCSGITCTVNAIQQAVRFGVSKFLYASSSYIYGNSQHIPITENHPIQSLNPYNIAKATGEYYVKYFSDNYNIKCVSMRYAPVYGPRRTIGPINDYIKCILSNKQTEIYGNKTRDYIYVSDIVDASINTLEKIKKPYSVFNVGSNTEVKLIDIYNTIADILKSDIKPIYLDSKPNEIERFLLDSDKIYREVGFRSKIKLREGLEKTIKWIKNG